MKMNILTSNPNLAYGGIFGGFILTLLHIVLYGVESSPYVIGFFLLSWGAISLGIIELEKKPYNHPIIPRCKTMGNISLIILFILIMLSNM